ncbi:hypothetical protein ACFFRR_002128 [Megaselia abdita]
MEYECLICSTKLLTIEAYCLHVNRHKPLDYNQRSQQFNCPLCLQTPSYQKVSKLKIHLKTCLEEKQKADTQNCNNEHFELPGEGFIEKSHEHYDHDSDFDMEEILELASGYSSGRQTFDDTLRYCLEWFAKKNISLKTAEEIINSTKLLVEKHLSEIGDKMRRCSSKEEIMQCFETSAYDVTRSLELLDTIQKVKTTARNKVLFAEPTQFVVRSETVQVLGEIEEKQAMGTLMPIKHEVKGFLEMPGVLQAIINNQNKMLASPLPNLVNGEIGKEILRRNEGKTAIFIGIYPDDFNPDNPLGPYSSTTKLSSYYYNYPMLPEHMSVNLSNIFLAAVHKSKDVDNEDVYCHGVDPANFCYLGRV